MVIFINGTISSGKSTVAKLLKKKIPNTVILEIDILRNLIDWVPLEEAVPLNLENAVSIIKNFVNREINVVIPYPLSQKNYNYLIDKLKDLNTKIYTFTLNPNPNELIKGERGRKLDNWEIERIKYHTKIGLIKPSFGITIDNTNQSKEETSEILFNLIKEKL
jgi:adenylate kinase family enzyme